MADSDKFTGYHWRLFAFLSVATFFEGYDFMALTQILPELREDFGLDRGEGGLLITVINVGTVLAYLLIRKADQWGRRRVLTVTIAGYTVFTGLSGLAPDAWWFAGLQLIARVFLIAEWATSFVIAAEEFPASKRGTVIGVIQAFVSAGAIVCAGVVPLLKKLAPEVGPAFLWLPEGTDYSWRIVYFVGVAPLVILAFARRNLRETRRFSEQAKKTDITKQRSLFYIFTTPPPKASPSARTDLVCHLSVYAKRRDILERVREGRSGPNRRTGRPSDQCRRRGIAAAGVLCRKTHRRRRSTSRRSDHLHQRLCRGLSVLPT